jgi:hypothetical protein
LNEYGIEQLERDDIGASAKMLEFLVMGEMWR